MSGKIPDNIDFNIIDSGARQQKKAIAIEKRNALNNLIDKDFHREEDPLRLQVLYEIKTLPTYTDEEYDMKYFLYNNGYFRTKEEIKQYNTRIEMKERLKQMKQAEERNKLYYEYGGYQEDCKEGKVACWIPVFIYVGLFLLGLLNPYHFFKLLMFVVFTSPLPFLVTLILQIRHSNKCIKLAEEYNVPKSDPNYQNAIITNRTAKLGIIAAGVTALHQGSKGLKSLENPDSWNVLK